MYTVGDGQGPWTNQGEGNVVTAANTQRYQSIVGSAMYLAQVSRYDILYGIHQFARAISNPSKAHTGGTQYSPAWPRLAQPIPVYPSLTQPSPP